MADIQRLPSDDELGSEACAWIARLNAHNVTAEDKSRFDAWRMAHPRHARAYGLASMVWQQMIDTGEVVRAVSVGQQFNATTERAIRRAREAQARGRRIAFAVAATVTVALCVGWWTSIKVPDTQFQTGIGEHATVKLPDGSSLELNSNSLARVVYSEQRRVVRLERGEAYFEVEHDARRPFWVAAGRSWVGAVGTAFNVDMRTAGIRVTVSEGAVKVAASVASPTPSSAELSQASVSLLRAGQQVKLQGAATEVHSLAPAQLRRSLAWRAGSVYFKKDRLADVVDELNRYTTLKIVLEDDGVRELNIGGTFETNAQGVEALLVNLKEGFRLNVRREGHTVYVSER